MFSEPLTYFWLLIQHWAAFVTGGVIVAVFASLERLLRRQFSLQTFVLVFIVFGFLTASYETWRDEYVARLQIQQDKSKPDPRKAQLEKFYIEGRAIANRSLPKDISPEAFAKYEADADGWLNNVVDWIQKNMGDVAKERFLDTSGMMTFSYGNAVNQEHSKVVNGVNNFCKNLQTLIVEFDAWSDKK